MYEREKCRVALLGRVFSHMCEHPLFIWLKGMLEVGK